MNSFKCSRCDYTSDDRKLVIRHQSSKKSKCKESSIFEEKVDILCKHCNNSFSMKKSLQRHLKICKVFNGDDRIEMSEQIKQLKEEVNKLKNSSKTTVNNNVTINVQLNGYREPSLDHIKDIHFEKIIKRMAYMIPNFIQLAHFSKRAPENHSICIKNLNGKYAHVYNGKKWIKMLKTEVIDDLIFGHEMSIRSWADDEERDPKLLKEYEHYENEKERSVDLVNKIKEEIGLVLYNNRDLIKTG